MQPDLWVEVDSKALKDNFNSVKSFIDDDTKIMSVVKANGFGHGLVEVSKIFESAGTDYLGVTRLDEAQTLRNAGVRCQIFVFAPILPENADDAIEMDLDLTITSFDLVSVLSRSARNQQKTAKVHIKVDTGMSRLGVLPQDVPQLAQEINKLSNIEIAGIYTHFAGASERNLSKTKRQLNLFNDCLDILDTQNISYEMAHCANSSALIRLKDSQMDMVRPGTILYGQYPSKYVPRKLKLKSTWELKARICEIKVLPKDTYIGYGGRYKTKRITKTAVVPIGYADGYSLIPDGPIYRQSLLAFAINKYRQKKTISLHSRSVPVIGSIAMQMLILDITDIPGVMVGDEVSIPALRIPINPLIRRVLI